MYPGAMGSTTPDAGCSTHSGRQAILSMLSRNPFVAILLMISSLYLMESASLSLALSLGARSTMKRRRSTRRRR